MRGRLNPAPIAPTKLCPAEMPKLGASLRARNASVVHFEREISSTSLQNLLLDKVLCGVPGGPQWAACVVNRTRSRTE